MSLPSCSASGPPEVRQRRKELRTRLPDHHERRPPHRELRFHLVVLGVALAACVLPAARAVRTPPAMLLKSDQGSQ